jgi:YVTN family beta-propeller protein
LRGIFVFAVLSCGVYGFASGAEPPRSDLPLEVIADAPLTGQTTRWDYASVDGSKHRLYLAHLGDSVVTVFDTQRREVVKDIPKVSHVHGVLAIPELGRVYASATGTDEVVAIDDRTLEITARVPAGHYPDGMAYAPGVHKLYVSDEHGNAETVIDVETNRRVATIALGGEVGNSQYDPVSRHIFANVQTLNQLVEIDPATDRVVERIDLPGAEGNHGLLIEPEGRRALIACEGNDRLLVLDLQTKKVTASFAVGKDPDVLALDPELRHVYVAGEAGVVSVFTTVGQISKIGEGFLGPNAHVVAVDANTHQAYFPLMNHAGRSVLRITRPKP